MRSSGGGQMHRRGHTVKTLAGLYIESFIRELIALTGYLQFWNFKIEISDMEGDTARQWWVLFLSPSTSD
jgi:hypothetical protein